MTENKTFSMVKDAVRHEAIKEHTGIPHMSLLCQLVTEEGAPKIPSTHTAITPFIGRPCSEGESHVRGTLLSRILESDSGRGINMM
jgi:hypothetical protein